MSIGAPPAGLPSRCATTARRYSRPRSWLASPSRWTGFWRNRDRLRSPGYNMKLLYAYLKHYWILVALALVLAAINQIFSLLDPLILRYVIDRYATRFREYTTAEFFRGVSTLLGAAVGVAFVS